MYFRRTSSGTDMFVVVVVLVNRVYCRTLRGKEGVYIMGNGYSGLVSSHRKLFLGVGSCMHARACKRSIADVQRGWCEECCHLYV